MVEKKNYDKETLTSFVNKNLKNDYIIQSNEFTILTPETNYDFKKKKEILKMILKLCDDNEIRFIKFFGPINIKNAINIDLHLKENEKFFKIENVEYYDNIILIPNDKFGDQIIHVKPNFKNEFTNKYFQLFKIKNII